MHLCYIDESGTSSLGNTSHFVLAGIAIPVWHWNDCDRAIRKIKQQYGLEQAEIHTAWMLRQYLEQSRIQNFSSLSKTQRRTEVERRRNQELLRLQQQGRQARNHYKQTKKNYLKTSAYVHLTLDERKAFIKEVAQAVSNWGYARLFAECIDKTHLVPTPNGSNLDKQAFSQIVSRFEKYLQNISNGDRKTYGLLIHDNNDTVARKHTQLMKDFHKDGTDWISVDHIIEAPLFVDSELTGMVQIADLCSYAIRRYLEKNEEELFDLVFQRADRVKEVVVGIRHYSSRPCPCKICASHATSQY